MHDLVLLVGYRGVGKTTIGRLLAKSLKYDFLDTDEEIVHRREMRVAEIVATEGWEKFRQYECEVLRNLRNLRATVVATGGGAVAHQREWLELRRRGVVFWLTAATHVLKERLQHDHISSDKRPSLTGAGLEEEIVTVLEERNPLYKQAAHHCIDTSQKQIQEIVSEMRDLLSISLIEEE